MSGFRLSPCKINLLLNILGRRADGFHELETLMLPIPACDALHFERAATGIALTCTHSELPTDRTNLVYRAAEAFLARSGASGGVRIHLEKRLPLAAGLGGGSSNAAHTLLGLNELFGNPLPADALVEIAAGLGSDVPFFLQPNPALATGRGEKVQPLSFVPRLAGVHVVLVHPGFGVSTPWAYRALANHPEAIGGHRELLPRMLRALQQGDLEELGRTIYNSLEAPVLAKHPVLRLYQQFFLNLGAFGTAMSGSGSTTFALFASHKSAEAAAAAFRPKFGEPHWLQVVGLAPPSPLT